MISTFFLGISSYGADSKIGIVDVHKVFEESAAGKAAKEEIKREGKKLEDDLKRRGEDLEAMKNKLEREVMVMSKEKREEKERDFRIKVGDFKALQRKYAEQLKERESELVKKFQDNIFQLVKDIGNENNYTLIIDKLGVLYAPSSVDITNQVIKAYDSRFGK
jgi:outer membrane protein